MMALTGKTKVCGVFGYPVAHSLSPALQNHIAELLGIDLVYVPFLVDPDEIAEAYQGVRSMHIFGVNATIPHKMKLVNLVQEIDEMAARIGAVNTLVPCEGGYKGYNTDYSGMKKALHAAGMDPAGRPVVLYGAGGAAQAVALALASEKIESLAIVNRTVDKAEALAAKVRDAFPDLAVTVLASGEEGKLQGEHFLAVQTTSVGMHPHEGVSPVLDESFYDRIDCMMDAIYSPIETEFMRQVRLHGGRAENGLRMLLFQGTDAFELWNRITIPDEVIEDTWRYLKELAGDHT